MGRRRESRDTALDGSDRLDAAITIRVSKRTKAALIQFARSEGYTRGPSAFIRDAALQRMDGQGAAAPVLTREDRDTAKQFISQLRMAGGLLNQLVKRLNIYAKVPSAAAELPAPEEVGRAYGQLADLADEIDRATVRLRRAR